MTGIYNLFSLLFFQQISLTCLFSVIVQRLHVLKSCLVFCWQYSSIKMSTTFLLKLHKKMGISENCHLGKFCETFTVNPNWDLSGLSTVLEVFRSCLDLDASACRCLHLSPGCAKLQSVSPSRLGPWTPVTRYKNFLVCFQPNYKSLY